MVKIDCDMMNLVNGEFKESKNSLDNLKFFVERQEEKIKEIKILCLNDQESYHLANNFLNEWEPFMYEDELLNKSTILTQLANDLILAITIANNNYRKQFPSFWGKFHKLKLPDLNLILNKN